MGVKAKGKVNNSFITEDQSSSMLCDTLKLTPEEEFYKFVYDLYLDLTDSLHELMVSFDSLAEYFFIGLKAIAFLLAVILSCVVLAFTNNFDFFDVVHKKLESFFGMRLFHAHEESNEDEESLEPSPVEDSMSESEDEIGTELSEYDFN